MNILIGILFVTALLTLWVVWGRPWLKQRPWAWSRAVFAWTEPYEIALWKKSETILFARFKMFIGVLLTTLTQIGAIDITPLMPFVPDQYEPLVRLAFNMLPLTLTILGVIDEKLRKDTTKPIELVSIAEKDMTPAVAEAVAVAETAKVDAVVAVKVAEVHKVADDKAASEKESK